MFHRLDSEFRDADIILIVRDFDGDGDEGASGMEVGDVEGRLYLWGGFDKSILFLWAGYSVFRASLGGEKNPAERAFSFSILCWFFGPVEEVAFFTQPDDVPKLPELKRGDYIAADSAKFNAFHLVRIWQVFIWLVKRNYWDQYSQFS